MWAGPTRKRKKNFKACLLPACGLYLFIFFYIGALEWVYQRKEKKTQKTYSIVAYYKDYMFYEVEAESAAEAKEIALANQEDWEKPDETWLELAGNAPIISSVKEV